MGQMIGKEYVPGPNDHHAVVRKDDDGKEHVELQPGLGADEATPEKMRAAKVAGDAKLKEIREALAKEAEELEGKADALAAQEEALNRTTEHLTEKEKALAEREAALEAREKALAAGNTGNQQT